MADARTLLWTLDELTGRVERALTQTADYAGPPDGRTRAVPDRRAIRWYTTTGLIDRPARMQGRTALYSERHLWQLVAIKRRQAAGATLAQIQEELIGATDAALRRIADVPGARDRFWAEPAPTVSSNLRPRGSGAQRPARLSEPQVVRLAPGVLLVLDRPRTGGVPDRESLCRAAAPLLAALAHPVPPVSEEQV